MSQNKDFQNQSEPEIHYLLMILFGLIKCWSLFSHTNRYQYSIVYDNDEITMQEGVNVLQGA